MKTQAFKMIAQSSIDSIDDHLKFLKRYIHQYPEPVKKRFYQNIDAFENEASSLIKQYNNLDALSDEKWDEAVQEFKITKDILKEELNQYLIKN
jgi:hypothetical protein